MEAKLATPSPHPTSHDKRIIHFSPLFSSPLLLTYKQSLRVPHLIPHHITNRSFHSDTSLHLFCSLGSKACDFLTSSHITSQIDHFSLGHFSSPLLLTYNQTLPLPHLIQHHMTNEHFSSHFSSPLLLTWKQSLRVPHLIPHHITNRSFHHHTSLHLFCSLTSKACEFLTSSHITSQIDHFSDTVLFTSFAHLEAKLASSSPHPTSHHKSIISQTLFSSPLLLTWKQSLRVPHLIPHHITNRSFLINHTSLHLFCSLTSKACEFLTSSHITSQTTSFSHFSSHKTLFSSPLLLTWKQSLRVPHLIPHHITNRSFLTTLLFTSFAHLQPNLTTSSPHPTSHDKRTFLSHFSSPLLLTYNQTLPLPQLIQHHMTNEF